MSLSSEVLKNWAVGQKAPEDGEEDLLEDSEAEPEEGESEHNALWAGEAPEGEINPEEAEALFDWLEEHEPEILDACLQLALALEEGDAGMIEKASSALAGATQYLNPEYEPLSDDQKKSTADNLGRQLEAKGNPSNGSPEHKQAVGSALAEARRAQEAPEEDAEEDSEEPETEEKQVDAP